ncbi:hypothetical protein ACIRRH_36760 [Kitasatospora sp. NPDC101235]|uniref:hypothetical protein n=1 Tax=Kitasatospora sp. NPDC101235 TaxID=3364101 RepID=UPI00382E8B03
MGEVFAAYGADPERARMLPGAEADTLYPMAAGGVLLRAGQLDGWTFCFEDREAEGVKPGVLARLCEHSEVVHLFYAVGMTVVDTPPAAAHRLLTSANTSEPSTFHRAPRKPKACGTA